MTKPYLLALDLGTTSIGHTVFSLDDNGLPNGVRDVGVRIFPEGRDPKSKEPLAFQRRMARGLRRNRDRGQNRVRRLVGELIAAGLLPEDNEVRKRIFNEINPYEARVQSVRSTVDAHTLGRTLFHLGRRRGFKSNRLSNDSEETEFKEKISKLREKLGNKTLGEYLYACMQHNHRLLEQGQPNKQQVVRFRHGEAEFYADRAMYQDEFKRIRKTQGNRLLNDEQWDQLAETIFFQHPLKPVPNGKCRFYPEEMRASVALPVAHRFRIYQEVNNLRYTSHGMEQALDERQRLAVAHFLDNANSLSFKGLLKKKDNNRSPYFPSDAQFNLDSASRGNKLLGNTTMYELRKPELLGELADQLSEQRINDLVALLVDPVKKAGDHEVLMETNEVEAAVRALLPELNDEQVRTLARQSFPRGTSSVSRKFMAQIVPVLRDTGLVYSEAIEALGQSLGIDLHHSWNPLTEHDTLPYYGKVLVESVWGDHPEADRNKPQEERDNNAFEYGKIANPTVHLALNQLRHVVNAIIAKQGHKPASIHVELTRDLKNSKDERARIQRAIADNQRERERCREQLKNEFGIANPSREDFQKIKLWKELGNPAYSVFSGKPIAASQLFSGEVEIEHIIPFSRCYDDGMGNKTLAFRNENQTKGNRTPAEAADDLDGYEAILRRALKAFGQGSKYNRFKKGAFEAFYGEHGERNMIERQLNDTRYISRIAARYLSCLFPKDVSGVVPVNGRMTAILRNVWQLNYYKDRVNNNYREDHRHHIVDAFVAGLISRHLINQTNRRRGRSGETDANLYHFLKARIDDIPELREQLFDHLNRVIASYKPDHAMQGTMFRDTAYGIRVHGKQVYGLTRKPVSSLSFREIFEICGHQHRRQIITSLTRGVGAENYKELQQQVGSAKDLQQALAEFSRQTGIRKLRIRVPDTSITAIASAPFKGYAKGEYAYCNIWLVPTKRDKKTGKWQYKYQGDFVSYADTGKYDANPGLGRPHPAAKKLMRLHKNDNLRLTNEETGETEVVRVAGYNAGANKLDIRPNLKATNDERKFKGINVIFAQHQVQKLQM